MHQRRRSKVFRPSVDPIDLQVADKPDVNYEVILRHAYIKYICPVYYMLSYISLFSLFYYYYYISRIYMYMYIILIFNCFFHCIMIISHY